MESYPIKDDKGKIVFKSLILKDVIGERMKEEENSNRNRMESIGKLAGGIAHDFNNVLTGILGYASLLKRMTPNEEQLNRYAEVIELSAKRAAVLTEHLLNFSRRQRTEKIEPIDLNALLGDILFLMRESFRTIEIATEFDEGLPPVAGRAGELQHAFLNLCVNAKDAMPEGGTLRVRTERKAYLGGRQYAVVTIEDTGRGMDERVKNRVFEPYFTTKTEDKNLGMGLYLVQKVIRDHNGFIEWQSDKEKGTAFTLYLPLAASGVERAKRASGPSVADVRKRRILVVDDEEVVRGLLTERALGRGLRSASGEGRGRSHQRIYGRERVDRPGAPRYDHAGHEGRRGLEEAAGTVSPREGDRIERLHDRGAAGQAGGVRCGRFSRQALWRRGGRRYSQIHPRRTGLDPCAKVRHFFSAFPGFIISFID